MFVPIPIQVRDGREFEPIPIVNGLLIALNVFAFWIGVSSAWVVGPGTGLFSPLTYAFAHANAAHLVGNMLALLVFGTPVNRRLGNRWYFAAYFGSALAWDSSPVSWRRECCWGPRGRFSRSSQLRCCSCLRHW